MRLARICVALSLALLLCVGTATAKPQAKNKKKHHGVHGIVLRVDKDKVNGTITIRVHHKKGAAAATVEQKTFRVTDLTMYEKVIVTGKGKDQRERKPAGFADVQPGKHVVIVPADRAGDARLVAIVQKKKG